MSKFDYSDVEDLLYGPHLARLATVHPDGRPHVSPVWFEFDGERFYFTMFTKGIVKARNLLHNPYVAFTIDTDQPPYRMVIVEGPVTWRKELTKDITRRLCVRYLGPELGARRAEKYLARADRTAFHVEPEVVVKRGIY